MRGPRPQYSREMHAAVLAALLAGQSVTEVAKKYKLPTCTVSRWRRKHPDLQGPAVETRGQRIGELLIKLLEHTLEKAHGQISFTDNKSWLEQQSAEGLAVLYGVTVDKAVRIAEALQPDQDSVEAPTGSADEGD